MICLSHFLLSIFSLHNITIHSDSSVQPGKNSLKCFVYTFKDPTDFTVVSAFKNLNMALLSEENSPNMKDCS